MNDEWLRRPETGEVPACFDGYVHLVPDLPILSSLRAQVDAVDRLHRELGEEWGGFRYEPGKWSVKEVLGHIIDTERIFVCRALHIARGEQQSLPGFDQDAYVAAGEFDARTMRSLIDEHAAVREATLTFFRSLSSDRVLQHGDADGREVTVRSIPYIIAGHEIHHLSVLERRYRPTADRTAG